ncbi:homoserine kinase [Trifolium medium]|uniref:Homoserine kinase n=1 Tax=Trifolium medium TaxID=97028 RepID=A0A392ST62_9FABA|nr:homoserine kinase [Trifolium medium]
MLGKALSSDKIVEPTRASFIPGMDAVKKVAIEAGFLGEPSVVLDLLLLLSRMISKRDTSLANKWFKLFKKKET